MSAISQGSDTTAIRPFEVNVSEADLANLRGRIQATRWPDKETKDPKQSPTIDDVLDNFTLYWLTNTAASSARIYWENRGRDLISAAAQKTDEISVPVAITVFPDEVFRAQEGWARRAFRNLIYFHEADRGGHFAMWEHPELFAAELRAAFSSLR